MFQEVSAEHQSPLDMVGGHTSMRVTLLESQRSMVQEEGGGGGGQLESSLR